MVRKLDEKYAVARVDTDILWRWYAHLLVSQIGFPPLQFSQYYLTYHIFQLINLQDYIVNNHVVAILFDLIFTCSILSVFIKTKNKWFNYATFMLFFVYYVTLQVNLASSAHYLSAMLMVSFLFLFNKVNNFFITFQALRYYISYVYVSAFLWKMLNGALFDWDTGIAVLQNNLTQYLYLNPETKMSSVYYWSLQHPAVVNSLSIFVYVLEAFFVVGFFTKRFDKLLIILILFIHFGLYLSVDTLFVEWYVFVLFFIPLAKWQAWNNKFNPKPEAVKLL